MNYKFILTIMLILAVISTVCVCVLKPQMHTTMLIFDSNYKIVEQKVDTQIEKEIPTITQESQPETIQTKIEEQILEQPKTVKAEPQQIVKTETKHSIKQTPQVQTKNKPASTVKTVSNSTQKIETKKAQTQTIPKTQTVNKSPEKLTEQQEEIEWNIWRSNLQNQLMKDVKLPIMPQGIVFKFEFDVDKYGKVSNVQTYSLNSAYTPYAIQYIAPVIRSYQGHSILNFPKGTQRVTTHVVGGWKIATQVKYSTPKDYNDTETVKR